MSGPGAREVVRRLARHEVRWQLSLVHWVARRRAGVAAGDRALAYAGAQAALMYGLTFVCLVETVGVSALLAGMPALHAVALVADVYTLLMMLGFQASAVTRPHVLGPDSLLLRAGARAELRIPLERIVAVRYDLRLTQDAKQGDGVLEMAVGGQTSATVELAEPVVAVGVLGRREVVRTVRFHADDARSAVAAVRSAVAAAAGRAAVDAAGPGDPVTPV
ncbi:hypothetical protein GCM10010211_16130 [Streptomyces albospinus]|uniref:Integral membrane protein n=1 Tax=Streptomyces albospinus TaxID=285515 RepID=A0ABQ2UVN9_9ACTN|nr:hypothetical protein [Streptomyces albospinus]GGU52496.1 hypothetical protein GCM10010211_16130 [Streptomyces albospinus]